MSIGPLDSVVACSLVVERLGVGAVCAVDEEAAVSADDSAEVVIDVDEAADVESP